jgi:hypothetical protein
VSKEHFSFHFLIMMRYVKVDGTVLETVAPGLYRILKHLGYNYHVADPETDEERLQKDKHQGSVFEPKDGGAGSYDYRDSKFGTVDVYNGALSSVAKFNMDIQAASDAYVKKLRAGNSTKPKTTKRKSLSPETEKSKSKSDFQRLKKKCLELTAQLTAQLELKAQLESSTEGQITREQCKLGQGVSFVYGGISYQGNILRRNLSRATVQTNTARYGIPYHKLTLLKFPVLLTEEVQRKQNPHPDRKKWLKKRVSWISKDGRRHEGTVFSVKGTKRATTHCDVQCCPKGKWYIPYENLSTV